MKKILIFIAIISLAFYSCKKDETKVVISPNPVAPVLSIPSDLTLLRTHATDTLTFTGTPVEVGFQASVNYSVEACAAGNDFTTVVTLFTGIKDDVFTTTVGELNAKLLTKFPADEVSSIDFRIKSSLVADVGTGVEPIVVVSETKNANVKIYGPPTLALTTAGTLQGITSPTDNKKYAGWIYTDGTAFQFTNKDDGKIYGGTIDVANGTGVLTENGPAIQLEAGAYNLTVDLTNLANIPLTFKDVTMGIIGDAVGGWDNDTKMIFDFTDRSWNITKHVTADKGVKFRTHGGWDHYNVAFRPSDHDLNDLYQSHGKVDGVVIEPDLGDSENITGIPEGDFNIKLFLETPLFKAVFAPAK